MELAGARVLVTGASSGIGAELAPQLAARGAVVGIAARRTERLAEVLERCRAHSPDSASWTVDLSEPEAGERLVGQAWDTFGGLDVLVNNAAIAKRKHLTTLTDADLAVTMTTNFTTPARMCLAVLPRMLEQGRGLIVNVSSMGGRLGIVHEAAYCAAKFALCGWSEGMRLDLEGTPVRVKLVLPGPIATEIWEPRPGELPGLYEGPFVAAADCAGDIVAAIEDPDGFEYYVPAVVPGGFDQKQLVVAKSADCDGFLAGIARMARGVGGRPAP